MLLRWRRLLFIIFLVHILLVLMARFFSHSHVTIDQSRNVHVTKNKPNQRLTIHVWGKAAIAEYLWLHLFEGSLNDVPGYMLQKGTFKLDQISFMYQTGPYLLPHTANKDIENLVIILNGRETTKIEKSKQWLDTLLQESKFPNLKNIGVILHGHEFCDNSWLDKYLQSMLLKFAYVTYDIKKISNKLLQWPLGVATYRHFPKLSKSDIDVFSKRKYVCNFLGTVYKNSSRESLHNILQTGKYDCFVKVRTSWKPKESKFSMNLYHDALKNSDLTLCPVGINSESYRIYESMSYGSVPVLEDVMTPGQCDSMSGPYKLLKKYNAPVIYVKHWTELEDVMRKEKLLTMRDIVKRRQSVLNWYEVFKYKLREEFIGTVKSTFEF